MSWLVVKTYCTRPSVFGRGKWFFGARQQQQQQEQQQQQQQEEQEQQQQQQQEEQEQQQQQEEQEQQQQQQQEEQEQQQQQQQQQPQPLPQPLPQLWGVFPHPAGSLPPQFPSAKSRAGSPGPFLLAMYSLNTTSPHPVLGCPRKLVKG